MIWGGVSDDTLFFILPPFVYPDPPASTRVALSVNVMGGGLLGKKEFGSLGCDVR